MTQFWQIIAGTPWWVFVLFFYLTYVGFLATKPHIISLKKLLPLPTVFTVYSLIYLCTPPHLTSGNVLVWVVAIILGAGLGWIQFYALKIKAIEGKNQLYVPGTWSLLIIILCIFAVKYYFGYLSSISPQTLLEPKYVLTLISLSGLVSGVFFGRILYAKRCMKVGPFYTQKMI